MSLPVRTGEERGEEVRIRPDEGMATPEREW
jgi:hypothetical protein